MDVEKLNADAKKARELSRIEKELINKFRRAQTKIQDRTRLRGEEYKPITSAIQNLIEKDESSNYKPITEAIENLQRKVETHLVPIQKSITFLPKAVLPVSYSDNDQDFDNGDEDSDLKSASTSDETSKNVSSEKYEQNPSGDAVGTDDSKQFDTPHSPRENLRLGQIATKFLPRAKDKTFGIYYDESKASYMIGAMTVKFDNNDLVLGNDKYSGSPGLWTLLTNEKVPNEEFYTSKDLENYEKILIDTDSMFQGNNYSSKKPKSSKGDKWTYLVKNIWKKYYVENKTGEQVGSGLLEYNNNDVEYKYVDNLNELVSRIHYIYSQEQAGNNNFHNEKIGILHIFCDRLEEIIDSPRGTEYLIRFISNMPSKLLKGDEKIGSGLFNSILKKIPFEMHAGGYNFLGPGTNLDARLKRGDVGVNPLDEAAKEHDIFYRDHPKTSDRHTADKILEDKAWNRLTSKNADMNERFWALATGTAMNLKQKFGMGLETKLKF